MAKKASIKKKKTKKKPKTLEDISGAEITRQLKTIETRKDILVGEEERRRRSKRKADYEFDEQEAKDFNK